MIRIWNSHLFFIIISLCLLTPGRAEELEGAKYTGFYADLGFGYRDITTSTSSVLSLNSTVIPSSISSGGASHTLAVLTGGYSFNLAHNFFLGIGANISPANGLTQQLQVQALNRNTTVSGIKSLYNYGVFITPGIQIEEGLLYLKAGKQTQVNNSNSSTNFNGYLLGLGYKQFIYDSIYLFGEADYSSYDAQTTSRTFVSSGRTINAAVTTTPQSSRVLLGVGYQF